MFVQFRQQLQTLCNPASTRGGSSGSLAGRPANKETPRSAARDFINNHHHHHCPTRASNILHKNIHVFSSAKLRQEAFSLPSKASLKSLESCSGGTLKLCSETNYWFFHCYKPLKAAGLITLAQRQSNYWDTVTAFG